jgi:hypothetical protein
MADVGAIPPCENVADEVLDLAASVVVNGVRS